MIPLKLRLHNFMCYREEQSLDFSGIHLACLTGDNGHGKSTLLDAITWALWGKARARARRRADHPRRDRDVGGVRVRPDRAALSRLAPAQQEGPRAERSAFLRLESFDFVQQTTAGPAREHRGQDDENGEWQVLDDGGLLERQAQIIRTLRLDYDTFTNSSFLLQGRADSFTVKTASERKQILADILGLSRYDLYEERAKAEAQTRKERAGLIEGEIKAIERDLARRADYEAQLSAARAAALAAVDALRLAEAEQAGCRSQVEGLRVAGEPACRSAQPPGPRRAGVERGQATA